MITLAASVLWTAALLGVKPKTNREAWSWTIALAVWFAVVVYVARSGE